MSEIKTFVPTPQETGSTDHWADFLLLKDKLGKPTKSEDRDTYSQMVDYLKNIARSLVGENADESVVEDLIADTITSARSIIHLFDKESVPIKEWLKRILTNQFNKEKIKLNNVAEVSNDSLTKDEFRRLADKLTGDNRIIVSRDPLREVLTQENLTLISEILDEMTPEDREIIVLRLIENLSIEEIAKALDRKEGTVSSQSSRATKRLREMLIKKGLDLKE